jgi:hypothetical protein
MKFQDSTAKNAPMDKSGMAPSALGILLVQVDTSGTINTEDAMQRPFNVHKTLNGMGRFVCAILDSTYQVTFVSVAHQMQLGTERIATHKFQRTNVEVIRF